MSTVGIDVAITMSTDKARTNISSFYKSLSAEGLALNSPLTLASGGGYEDIDVSDNTFIIIIADEVGLANEVLNLTLTDSVSATYTIQGVGFFMLNFNNLTNIRIINSYTADVDIIVLRG